MSDEPAIAATGLSKDYGSGRGLFELNLEVAPGEIFGFLGPNGAGKSTTMRLLLDLIRPTSGSARVLGLDIGNGSLEIRRRVGFLPPELFENPCLFIVAIGWNDQCHVLADRFLGRITEQALRTLIPAGDDAVEIFADDGVVGAIHNGSQQAGVSLGLPSQRCQLAEKPAAHLIGGRLWIG